MPGNVCFSEKQAISNLRAPSATWIKGSMVPSSYDFWKATSFASLLLSGVSTLYLLLLLFTCCLMLHG